MSNSGIKIYKGVLTGVGEHRGIVKVWLPTKDGDVPLGRSEYFHENTGSALSGVNLEAAKDSSISCRIATSLSDGAWFTDVAGKGASVFDHWYRDGDPIYDYRKVDYSPRHTNGLPPTLVWDTDRPQITLAAFNPTLNLAGGTPTPKLGQMPPGDYPQPGDSKWVLVAEVDSSIEPFVIAQIPSDEAWKTIYG